MMVQKTLMLSNLVWLSYAPEIFMQEQVTKVLQAGVVLIAVGTEVQVI